MSFFTNLFSGNSYTKLGSILINNDTEQTFQKLGSNYIADDGAIINKLGNQLINQETNVSSYFGDPFAKSNGDF
jgi:hypothetical protein